MPKWRTILASACLALVAIGSAGAGPVEDLTTFTAGTPAKADEVNANFAAVAEAVSDNDARTAALEAVGVLKPDLVFLDIALPDMSGYDVARRIVAAHSQPPNLVALTGYGQPDDRVRSAAAGFHAHMVKPLGMEALVRLLKDLFDGSHARAERPG